MQQKGHLATERLLELSTEPKHFPLNDQRTRLGGISHQVYMWSIRQAVTRLVSDKHNFKPRDLSLQQYHKDVINLKWLSTIRTYIHILENNATVGFKRKCKNSAYRIPYCIHIFFSKSQPGSNNCRTTANALSNNGGFPLLFYQAYFISWKHSMLTSVAT